MKDSILRPDSHADKLYDLVYLCLASNVNTSTIKCHATRLDLLGKYSIYCLKRRWPCMAEFTNTYRIWHPTSSFLFLALRGSVDSPTFGPVACQIGKFWGACFRKRCPKVAATLTTNTTAINPMHFGKLATCADMPSKLPSSCSNLALPRWCVRGSCK